VSRPNKACQRMRLNGAGATLALNPGELPRSVQDTSSPIVRLPGTRESWYSEALARNLGEGSWEVGSSELTTNISKE